MGKAYTFLVLGVWMAILPYLGFPHFWKNILTTLSGIVLIFVSYLLYKEFKTKEIKEESTVFDNFSENSDFAEKEAEIEQEENNNKSATQN